MAVWEARKQVTWAKWGNRISQVSWTDGTAMDVYYWMEHSFQFGSDINTDDEMHWIKLATKAVFTPHYSKCQLTSVGNNWVVALNVSWLAKPIWFDETNFLTWWTAGTIEPTPDESQRVCPWVVFQNYFWFADNDRYNTQQTEHYPALCARKVNNSWDNYILRPYDHPESTDESIEDPTTASTPIMGNITAILNYNNSRLVVATSWPEAAVWVYYPELDQNSPITHPTTPWVLADHGTTGWKKVWTYEAWVTIVGLTCSFEYLKVRAVDEWWNTQVYYYQGNNNLRNTFVYNLVDLKWVRVVRVYSINWIDYYVSSIDGSDWFVNLYKLVGNTPVQLFKTRAWLSTYDTNTKAAYFVWPVWLDAAYYAGKFYIADSFWLFQFSYAPQSFDKWYMKWRLKKERWDTTPKQVYWVCENKGRLYVSTEEWCYVMRVIDTGKPPIEISSSLRSQIKTEDNLTESQAVWRLDGWFQEQWILISREYEGKEWGTATKMLDEIRLNFELNPLTLENWQIDIFVSPNNLWKDTKPSYDGSDKWFRVMHIDQASGNTRTEKSNLLNDLHEWDSAFRFDWQTITYAIVITRGNQTEATPIVRQIDIKYHCKDKTNNVYDIN